MAESSGTTLTIFKVFDDVELNLFNRHEQHLCNSLARLNLCLWPSPERGSNTAASPGSPM